MNLKFLQLYSIQCILYSCCETESVIDKFNFVLLSTYKEYNIGCKPIVDFDFVPPETCNSYQCLQERPHHQLTTLMRLLSQHTCTEIVRTCTDIVGGCNPPYRLIEIFRTCTDIVGGCNPPHIALLKLLEHVLILPGVAIPPYIALLKLLEHVLILSGVATGHRPPYYPIEIIRTWTDIVGGCNRLPPPPPHITLFKLLEHVLILSGVATGHRPPPHITLCNRPSPPPPILPYLNY